MLRRLCPLRCALLSLVARKVASRLQRHEVRPGGATPSSRNCKSCFARSLARLGISTEQLAFRPDALQSHRELERPAGVVLFRLLRSERPENTLRHVLRNRFVLTVLRGLQREIEDAVSNCASREIARLPLSAACSRSGIVPGFQRPTASKSITAVARTSLCGSSLIATVSIPGRLTTRRE